MTESLPENVRQAGYNALEELSTRMFRGATSLLKHAVRLRMEEPKSHQEALAQLRRYRGFKMPCSEEVAIIEGALTSLTEPESKALTERRRIQKMHKDTADRARAEEVRKSPPPTYWEIMAAQEKAMKPHQGANVIAGPWDAGGEARP